MKVIRKEQEELLFYKWDGNDSERFIDKMNNEYNLGAKQIKKDNTIKLYLGEFTTITLKPTDYLLWGQYSGFSKASEQEFKEQYEVIG